MILFKRARCYVVVTSNAYVWLNFHDFFQWFKFTDYTDQRMLQIEGRPKLLFNESEMLP